MISGRDAFNADTGLFLFGAQPTLVSYDANRNSTSDDTTALSLGGSMSATSQVILPILAGPNYVTTANVRS